PVIESAAVIPALLQRLPDATAAQRYLPALASGEQLGTIAFEDPQHGIALDPNTADLVLFATEDRVMSSGSGTDGAAASSPKTAGTTTTARGIGSPSDAATATGGVQGDSRARGGVDP